MENKEIEEKKITLAEKDFKTSHNRLPRFPRLDLSYRVYWNWEITYECNYRCSYCILWKEHKERYPYVKIDRWKEIWDRIFEKYWCSHIRFSGGEPFIYHNFIDLVAMLSEKHTIDITTNLTFDIEQFLKKIEPGGITLSASFHPEFAEIDYLFEKVLFLNKKGFPTNVIFEARPSYLVDLDKYKSAAQKMGILLKIIPFLGEFEGKKYPQSYSDRQRELLEEVVINRETQFQKQINSQWFNQDVNKNNFMQDRLCRMGQMYAKISPNGDITRCCHYESEKLGSIFDDDFRLLDEPMICKIESCPCWKPMIVGHQEDRYPIFWGMSEHKIYKLKKP